MRAHLRFPNNLLGHN